MHPLLTSRAAFMIFLSVVISLILGVTIISSIVGDESPPTTEESVVVPVKLETYTDPDYHPPKSINELRTIAESTYPKFISCLTDTPHAQHFDFGALKLPADAEQHYEDLLNQTKIFRGIYMHSHAYYQGPWIENYFIHNFLDKPLSYFSGLFPLFIQWTDIHVHDFSENKTEGLYKGPYIPEWQRMAELVAPLLRKDVIYVTVIQDDEGMRKKLALLRPNILTLSAGGFGHIPIPLIKGEFKWVPPPQKFQYDIGFYGSFQRHARASMFQGVKMTIEKNGLTLKMGESKHWVADMLATKFNLAPRGFGRTSFRLAEIIQVGRLPIYMYDDLAWVPYGNSNISVNHFGFVTQGRMHIGGVCATIKGMTDDEYSRRLDVVKQVREHYTYPGVIRQIDKFFQDPFGPTGGQLVCHRVPNTEKRRV